MGRSVREGRLSNSEIGAIVLTLSVLTAAVHVLGYVFEKLRQPRLVGEISAGVLLGPFVLGRLAPGLSEQLFGAGMTDVVLNFINWIGLFLLMFLSGSETRRLIARENQRETAWLFGVGTTVPLLGVLALGFSSLLPLDALSGPGGQTTPVLLVLAVAVAVTSIPVISRIFMDLKIIHTRFASLVLGFAVLEDIVLWAVLAVATGIAEGNGFLGGMISHVVATFVYLAVALTIAPRVLKRIHDSRWNLVVKASPVGYIFFLLFLYAAAAALLDVNLVFASFLAGFGLVGGVSGSERARFSPELESVSKVATGVFIPMYFALVGYRLILGQDFSFPMFAAFLFGSSLVVFISFGVAAWLAGFRGLDVVNLAITKNARGGPGIVLASVAFEAGIINAAFYTTLILTAVVTSQTAAVWLRHVLVRGLPLLSNSPDETWASGPHGR
jgi:Kef-type K+ transport system membrane component KefB